MLNSQPLGFYTPSQLVQDARRHDIVVRPADVLYSDWDCTMEENGPQPAVRLGLRLVKGLKKTSAERIVKARAGRYFGSAEEVAMLAELEHLDMRQLAAADALRSLSGHRRQQVWDAAALRRPPALLRDAPVDEPELELEAASEAEEVLWDYRTMGLTLRAHPLELLRPELDKRRFSTAADLSQAEHGDYVHYVGLVTLRQAPPTAKGVMFMTLEDETGNVQVIVWPDLRDEFRKEVYGSRLLVVEGTWQDREGSYNLIAKRFEDLTYLVDDLVMSSRDFQ